MPDADPDELAPESLNYPETLRITIASPENGFEGALEDARTADTDGAEETVVSFRSADGVRRLLTDRRLELLRSLMDEPGESISEVAQRLDRSYSVVHEDIDVLAECGVVKFRQRGQSKQPFVPYETVEFDVTIGPQVTEDDTEALA